MKDETNVAVAEGDLRFPPRLTVGNRVWTATGYRDHGPENGPKVDIGPNQGGTITASQENEYTRIIGDLLITVQWDDGQVSKHYSGGLFCIGRFQTRAEYEEAIQPVGPVELTVGPAGGFRHARLEVEYDGRRQAIELYSGDLWRQLLEPKVMRSGCTVTINKLPGKRKSKPNEPRKV